MVRGIERTTIVRDDTDRADFLARLTTRAESGALTDHAGAFTRRHKRVGHRFQNRYISIVVVEESYLCLR